MVTAVAATASSSRKGHGWAGREVRRGWVGRMARRGDWWGDETMEIGKVEKRKWRSAWG